jgi:Ras-related protein Rab-7A
VPSYKATIGADFSTHDMTISGQPVALQVWDTAGQERFHSLSSAFYKGADCCILVFDLTNAESFSNLDGWQKEFTEKAVAKDGESIPFVVLGNKVDQEMERQVSNDKAKSWCRYNGNMPYFETSAKEGTQVLDAFISVAGCAMANRKNSVYSFLL